MFFFEIKSLYSSSAFSNIAMTFLLTLFSRLINTKKDKHVMKVYNIDMSMLKHTK